MNPPQGGGPSDDETSVLLSLLAATNALVQAETRASVCRVSADAAESVLGLSVSAVHLLSESGDTLEPVGVTDHARSHLDGGPPPIERGDGVVWETFEAGETAVIPDVDAIRDRAPNPETEARSAVVVPVGGHGVLVATSLDRAEFTDREVRAAELLATATATALDRVETQRRLRRQNERLEQLAGVISHDLKSPLSVARGWTAIAREEEDPTAALERVEDALDRITTLVDDLISLARTGVADSERTHIGVAAVADEVWTKTEGTEEATLTVEEGLPSVLAVRSLVHQLFENLFRNAVEHGAPDVSVRVGPLADGGFYVEDDGPGIPEDVRDRVLDHGYTTGDGTGFGLAIVDAVAEAHDWTVAVTDGERGGARFEFSH